MTFLIAVAVIVLIAVGLLSFTARKEACKLREQRGQGAAKTSTDDMAKR